MLNIGGFARLGQVSPRMLRHYHETGLLVPSSVDPNTGYRYYQISQVSRLHRLLALRDLGFTLEQVRPLLDGDLSVDELSGMLRMRRAQIEQGVADDLIRLSRVEAHLKALKGDDMMQLPDAIIKRTDRVRIAESVATAPGVGAENVGPLFVPLSGEVFAHLKSAGIEPGISVGHYEKPADDGTVRIHVGFDVGTQRLTDSDRVQVVELPIVEVASMIHRGAMDGLTEAFDGLIRWTAQSGYELVGPTRELYHLWDYEDPTRHVTELQVVVTPKPVQSSTPAPSADHPSV